LGAGQALKIGPGDLVDAAATNHSRRGFTRISLEPGNQLFQIFCRKVLPRYHPKGCGPQERYRLEVI
jgi:hypothetical protein